MAYRMGDDSVTLRGKGRPKFSGKSVTRRGEDTVRTRGYEPGRTGHGTQQDRNEGAAGRRTKPSSARDVTSVRPLDPIDPTKMPNLR